MIAFQKMHGLGNDFVIIDNRENKIALTPEQVALIGNRHRGVGFDQLAEIRAHDDGDAALVFWNQDGSLSGACGNATRCVAHMLMQENGQDSLRLISARGELQARRDGQDIAVNMGHALTRWQDVPLAQAVDTLHIPVEGPDPRGPTATGMGNPHCSFFVDNVANVNLEVLGRKTEPHSLFPEHTNVQIAQILDNKTIRMRVWERGVGITESSGSSSCAVASAAYRRGLTGPEVAIHLDGGILRIRIAEDGIWMTGEVAYVFNGVLSPDLFREAL